MSINILEIENLEVTVRTKSGPKKALDGVTLHVADGEVLCVVGESGCGKSLTALSLMGLLPISTGCVSGGVIRFKGEDLCQKSAREFRAMRGRDLAMIFQEPMTSLNPVLTIGEQIAETIRLHQGTGRAEALSRAVDILRMVGMPAAEQRLREYPHQLSGGMRQRIMIAIALACKPSLLIADEPTTALDVTIQAQILDLMRRLRAEIGMAMMLITHDLGVVAGMADRVAVMYLGKVVEEGNVQEIFENPLHPYTQGLLKSIPGMNRRATRLYQIPGTVPDLTNIPTGCRFNPRCAYADDYCRSAEPPLEAYGSHSVMCWNATVSRKEVAV
ncbi:MAG: ABC transporter ATP-binding protein [Bacillota bacterium]|nr:ABC transporter ATP-binding protein [Bacillota bacterium]